VSASGTAAAIALSADGRAVVVWDNGTVLQSSAMAPDGALRRDAAEPFKCRDRGVEYRDVAVSGGEAQLGEREAPG
jgi:hypothetical protein